MASSVDPEELFTAFQARFRESVPQTPEGCSQVALRVLAELYPAQQVYFPRSMALTIRNREIHHQIHSMPVQEIARRHGLKSAMVYRILQRKKAG